MRRKTHATFSADRNSLNFDLPKSWADLSQKELRMVLHSRARWSEGHVSKLAIFMHFTQLEILYKYDKVWVCRVPVNDNGKVKKYGFNLDPAIVDSMLDSLNWLDEPGSRPVRLDRLHGATALPAEFHGVPFGTYLQCENLYQGIMQSQSPEAVSAMLKLLYPGIKKGHIQEWVALMIIQWWAQLKTLFGVHFQNFFKPAEDGGGVADMTQIMNNQIRALTEGDVTKENEILALDTWRALTELDAKAKEAEEFKLKTKTK